MKNTIKNFNKYYAKQRPCKLVLTFIAEENKLVTLNYNEFTRLANAQASKIINKIFSGELEKDFIYLYAYIYHDETMSNYCGYILNKKYDLDEIDYNLFVDNIRKQHKYAKFKSIKGDLL